MDPLALLEGASTSGDVFLSSSEYDPGLFLVPPTRRRPTRHVAETGGPREEEEEEDYDDDELEVEEDEDAYGEEVEEEEEMAPARAEGEPFPAPPPPHPAAAAAAADGGAEFGGEESGGEHYAPLWEDDAYGDMGDDDEEEEGEGGFGHMDEDSGSDSEGASLSSVRRRRLRMRPGRLGRSQCLLCTHGQSDGDAVMNPRWRRCHQTIEERKGTISVEALTEFVFMYLRCEILPFTPTATRASCSRSMIRKHLLNHLVDERILGQEGVTLLSHMIRLMARSQVRLVDSKDNASLDVRNARALTTLIKERQQLVRSLSAGRK